MQLHLLAVLKSDIADSSKDLALYKQFTYLLTYLVLLIKQEIVLYKQDIGSTTDFTN